MHYHRRRHGDKIHKECASGDSCIERVAAATWHERGGGAWRWTSRVWPNSQRRLAQAVCREHRVWEDATMKQHICYILALSFFAS